MFIDGVDTYKVTREKWLKKLYELSLKSLGENTTTTRSNTGAKRMGYSPVEKRHIE